MICSRDFSFPRTSAYKSTLFVRMKNLQAACSSFLLLRMDSGYQISNSRLLEFLSLYCRNLKIRGSVMRVQVTSTNSLSSFGLRVTGYFYCPQRKANFIIAYFQSCLGGVLLHKNPSLRYSFQRDPESEYSQCGARPQFMGHRSYKIDCYQIT